MWLFGALGVRVPACVNCRVSLTIDADEAQIG